MSGKWRPRKSNGSSRYVSPHDERDDRASRFSSSRGNGRYSNHEESGVSPKLYSPRLYRRKSRDSNPVYERLNSSTSSNHNGTSRHSSQRLHGRRGSINSSRGLIESDTGWYNIFVHNVNSFDYEEALKTIQNYTKPVVFYPYNKRYAQNVLSFLVNEFKTAKILQNTSSKITIRSNVKLIIKVSVYIPPLGLITFKPVPIKLKEKMIVAMASRYNVNTKCLDLSQFYECPLFTESQMFVPLNKPSVLLAALNMIAQHTNHDLYGLSLEKNYIYLDDGIVWLRRLFPNLKVLNLAHNKFTTLKQLHCLSGYSIEELNLSKNPLCDIDDKESYTRTILELFPLLNKLDNAELPSRYRTIVGSKLKMPACLGNSYPSLVGQNPKEPNQVKTMVETFLSLFYQRYDNHVSKQSVGEAYHGNATFSMSCTILIDNMYAPKFRMQNYVPSSSLEQYTTESRNLTKTSNHMKIKNKCFLHKGKENIIEFLEKLPKTKHDMDSLLVDVLLATPSMVLIMVNGVFAEDYHENEKVVFRSFSRTICLVPARGNWRITNDMLFITACTREIHIESSKRFNTYLQNSVSLNNSNSDANFTEDMDDTQCKEASTSSYQQAAISNCLKRPRQETTIFSFQPLAVSNSIDHQWQQLPYQNQQTTFQQQNRSVVNSELLNRSSSKLNVTSSTLDSPLSPPSISCLDSNLDEKLTLIKSFSNESGMNLEWSKKCLEDNQWNYAKAAISFSTLKANIPSSAFEC